MVHHHRQPLADSQWKDESEPWRPSGYQTAEFRRPSGAEKRKAGSQAGEILSFISWQMKRAKCVHAFLRCVERENGPCVTWASSTATNPALVEEGRTRARVRSMRLGGEGK